MAKYILTNKAVKDLTKIWNYTLEKWSEQQADNYYKMLILTCEEIVNNPNIGKKCSETSPKLLGIRANFRIIFYRKIDEYKVEITRILHDRMDLRNQIQE